MTTLLYGEISGFQVPLIPVLIVIPAQSPSLYAIQLNPVQVQVIQTADDASIVSCCVSPAGRILVFVSQAKQLSVYRFAEESSWLLYISMQIPFKSPQSMCVTNSEKDLLLADKSGAVYAVSLDKQQGDLTSLSPILGHCSMLTAVRTNNTDDYVITADSEGKIRISQYPNAYNIHTFLLAHTEFISHISLLPDSPSKLVSGSGDGCVKLWEFKSSVLCSTLSISSCSSPICLLDVSPVGTIVVAVEGKTNLYFVTIQDNALTLIHVIELQSQPCSGCFVWKDLCLIATEDTFRAFHTSTESNFREVSVAEDLCLSYLCSNKELCRSTGCEESKYSILKKRPISNANKYFEQKQEWIDAKKQKLKVSNKTELLEEQI